MPTPPVLKQNTTIGDWKLSKHLGSGGQGEVWAARSSKEAHSPPRALKVCFAADAKAQARFVREIDLLSSHRHTHILSLLEANSKWIAHVQGAPAFAYFVGELCDGSLSQNKAALGNILMRLDLFKQACAAVAFLHGRASPVLHRDIKPDNFLIAKEPRRVVLGDFGIAKSLDSADQLTATQEVVGTPHYRAPEVLNGGEGTERSDVYSLGRLLEWLLTDDISQDLSVVRAVPRNSSITDEACDALDALVRKATSLSASDRFPTVEAVLGALPDLVVGLRPTKTASVPLQMPITQDVRSRALKLAAANDIVGWRELEAEIRREYPRRATAWCKSFEARDHQTKQGIVAAADDLMEIALPRIVLAMSAIYSDTPRFMDQRGVVTDLKSVPDWPRSGPTALVEATSFPVFVYHHLHGALCSHLGVAALPIDLLELDVSTSLTHGKLRTQPGLTTCPKLLGDDVFAGWEYLRRIQSRFSEIADFFALKEDFEIGLAAHSMILSMLELAFDADALTKAQTGAVPRIAPLSFVCPPQFVLMPASTIAFAAAKTFGDSSTVERIAKRASVSPSRMRQVWPAWSQAINEYRGLALPNRHWGADLPLGELA